MEFFGQHHHHHHHHQQEQNVGVSDTAINRDFGRLNLQDKGRSTVQSNFVRSAPASQNYEALKQSSLQSGVLFEDDQFPCDPSSLFFSQATIPIESIQWLRPKEISPNACLVKKTCVDCSDEKSDLLDRNIIQGELGNCWFIAACTVLSNFPKLWHVVIPDHKEQEMDNNYAGIFKFKFWQLGVWTDVIIDDRLPTVNGQLIYSRSKHEDEFWGSLLEKAYAKLNGSYQALDGGNLTDALVDFTGGVAEIADIQRDYRSSEQQLQLFQQMQKELLFNGLMCAAINIRARNEMQARLSNGLVKGHAYGIIDVQVVRSSHGRGDGTIRLVRPRNPWGKTEWNGRFSDGSSAWNEVSEEDRQAIGTVVAEDGEFWMDFQDFLREYTELSLCRLIEDGPSATVIIGGEKNWCERSFRDQWLNPDRAGGCVNNGDSFFNNPQYCFDVETSDEDIHISVSQPDNRFSSNNSDGAYLAIGFCVIRIESNRTTRINSFEEQPKAPTYSASRHVTMKITLDVGRYCVIPTTFEAGVEGDFLLRILTSYKCTAMKLE